MDHVVKHGDDVDLAFAVVLDDPVDGVLELLVVPDGLRDVLVDVVRALCLLVTRDDDISVPDDLRYVLVDVVRVLLCSSSASR